VYEVTPATEDQLRERVVPEAVRVAEEGPVMSWRTIAEATAELVPAAPVAETVK
jgi:hypothetical protein